MKLTYAYENEVMKLTETPNDADVEFELHMLSEEHWKRMKEVQKRFESDEVYTDVLFYPYENFRIRAIVRHDYYTDFILELMKHRLLTRVEWM